MHTTIKLFFVALLSLPVHAFAQTAPSPVTGITLEERGGQVTASWNPTASDPIDHYRVYISHESILGNDGYYDDFEVTPDNTPTLTFDAPADTDVLYVAVIAVTDTGAESEFFTEEARIELTGGMDLPPTGVFTEVTEQPTADEMALMPLKLLRGSVPDAETMVVTFSADITVDASKAPEALHITAPDGSALLIRSITIQGKTVTIRTAVQMRGRVYNVAFSEPFRGMNGQALDNEDRAVLLTGHSSGTGPEKPLPPVQNINPATPADLQNVSMETVAQPDGLFTVTLRWTPVIENDSLYGIVAYQTRDGSMFGPPSLLPLAISGVQLKGVTPGFFGIYLQVVNTQGTLSPGIFQYVTLPSAPLQGDLTFGGTDTSVVDDTDNLVQLTPISDSAPLSPLSAMHAAADEPIWQRAVMLFSSVVVLTLAAAAGIVWTLQRRGSKGA